MEEALLRVPPDGHPLLSSAMTSFICIIRISSKNRPTKASSGTPNVRISPGVGDNLCGYVVMWSHGDAITAATR